MSHRIVCRTTLGQSVEYMDAIPLLGDHIRFNVQDARMRIHQGVGTVVRRTWEERDTGIRHGSIEDGMYPEVAWFCVLDIKPEDAEG